MDSVDNESVTNSNSYTRESLPVEAKGTRAAYDNNAHTLIQAARRTRRSFVEEDHFNHNHSKNSEGLEFLKLSHSKKSVWATCCNEVAQEIIELNKLLETFQLPASNYSKEKSFPLREYDEDLEMETCHTQTYLDTFVLPFLLPGILSLLEFAKKNFVFQCRYITFNSLDFLSEYLYNNNPLHQERLESPKEIDDIVFVENWQQNFPRPPLPNWLTMSEDTAAVKIQRAIRGFLARSRPDIKQMREYWKEYKNDMEKQPNRKASTIFSLTVDMEENDETDLYESEPIEVLQAHSQSCEICIRFKDFFDQMDAAEEQRLQLEREREESEENSSEGEEMIFPYSLHEEEHEGEMDYPSVLSLHSIHSGASVHEDMGHSPPQQTAEQLTHSLSSNITPLHVSGDLSKMTSLKGDLIENEEQDNAGKHLPQ